MTLGERLKKVREEKGLLQNDTANYLKVSQKTISNYEKNERRPDPDTLKKLAQFYDVTTDYLLGSTQESQAVDYSPLDKFIIDFKNLPDKDRKEAVKRLINLALEEDPSNKGNH